MSFREKLTPLQNEVKSPVALNPLDIFPSKKDTISNAFFSLPEAKSKRKLRKLDDRVRWLHADKLDASFGVVGQSQDDMLRRAFRRIESSTLFAPVTTKDAPLNDIVPNYNQGKKFVVVEESRLQELTRLETLLRKERVLLGEQCRHELSDFQMEARIPVPATRLAVRTFCEQQMKTVEKEVLKLKENWMDYCRKNHYHKPHLYLKDSYVKNAPVAQRALKLRLVREAVETWCIRKDRDTMLFEDDLSYLMGKYHEARVRQSDYERYYILACRYGVFSESEFNKDPRPGRRYFTRATTGAVKFQLLWDRYWSMQRLRRFRAARMIQKYWRRRFCYKQYHPIIKLRLKIGKKTYYMYCWHAWLHYNYLCRRIKEALNYNFNTFLKNNFLALKQYVHGVNAARAARAFTMTSRAKNMQAYFKFMSWVRYVQGRKRTKIRLKRLFGFPQFDMWLDYVKWCKHQKAVHKAAAIIQAMGRALIGRARFLRMKRAQKVLRHFNFLVLAVRLVRERRKVTIKQEFVEWIPEELTRRATRANEAEKQRLVKRQQFVAEKEKGAIQGLRKHLNAHDGKLQLQEMLRNPTVVERLTASSEGKFYSWSRDEKMKSAARSLAEECSRVIRGLESHNYNAKHPPFLTCPDLRCNAIFTTEPQYHNHMKCAHPHCGAAPQFSDFHMMLRHQRGQDLFRTYLTRAHGIGGLVNLLDCWSAIQEWRKLQTGVEQFDQKAITIMDLYLAPDAARRLHDLSALSDAGDMLSRIRRVKDKDYKGLYRPARAKPGLVRGLLQMQGEEYFEFTTEDILHPDIFQSVEWHCFLNLFTSMENDTAFQASVEYQSYLGLKEEESKHKQEELLRDYDKVRTMKIAQWARQFKGVERSMFDRAGDIVDVLLAREVELLYKGVERTEVHRRTKEKRHEEQGRHEATALLATDAAFWAEDNILDDIYDHYVTSLINKMLELPDCRKGLLQYGGFLKAQSRHMQMHVDAGGGGKGAGGGAGKEDWYKEFLVNARKSEKGAVPSGGDEAATVIQRHVRGVLGRKKARKVFLKTYLKMYDAQYGAAYYQNTKTGESSWDRPRMTRHLFHKLSNW